MEDRQGNLVGWVTLIIALLNLSSAHAQGTYSLFEIGQVRPLALADNGQTLYALNTPDDRLEIFRVRENGLELRASVPVGMRPVSLAVRNGNEVWVVNHLSDSISIVDCSNANKPYVVRTLLVGDEPRDVVFAGPNRNRAFITTAHRGQNVPYDPQFTTPGLGRADVWVFDADRLGQSLRGAPLTILSLFADTPRALAVSPDGKTVYAAPYFSGNGTTAIALAAATPQMATNAAGEPQPQTGLIAKFENGFWNDSIGKDVSDTVNLSLPDNDVFMIDAMTLPPRVVSPSGIFHGVGTTIFNMIVNPRSGALYVSNTEANNFTRFEGPGIPNAKPTVRGNLAQSRITVISQGRVTPVHLNKHINYNQCCAAPGNIEARKSLASPREMVVTGDGKTLYVAAHDSSKVGIFDTARLENNSFVPDEAAHIVLSGGGPTGLVLDEQRQRLYALTRFNNAVTIIDTRAKREIAAVRMRSPEPQSVIRGRSVLYDAFKGSSHGDSSCASCHIDGGLDQLAWDLGDPTAVQAALPGSGLNVYAAVADGGTTAFAFSFPECTAENPFFCTPESMFHVASLKGPMTTQTLRGLDNHGPMHWRGDRTGGTANNPGAQPNTGMFDERAAFKAFNVAFPGLLGRNEQIADADMTRFTDFALQIMLPPNPVRNLDNSLTEQQTRGREIYFGGRDGTRKTDVFRACVGCHRLDPEGNAQYGVARPGFFGTDGRFADDGILQFFKVPHLRNAYDKVGMFGTALQHTNPLQPIVGAGFTFHGDQVRGFGFNNDGALATIFDFLSAGGFSDFGDAAPFLGLLENGGGFIPQIPAGTYTEANVGPLGPDFAFLLSFNATKFQSDVGTSEKRAVEAFVLAFDTNFKPIVGQQVTLQPSSNANANREVSDRIHLLLAQATEAMPRPVCDLVAHGNFRDAAVSYLYNRATRRFDSSTGETNLDDATLRSRASQRSQALTYTCVPPGEGRRRAFDRDR